MKNKILMLVAIAATAGLIVWGCQSGQVNMGQPTDEIPTGSVPMNAEFTLLTGGVGSTMPVTKDIIDDCDLGMDGEGSGSPENVTSLCTMVAAAAATVPGGLVPIVARLNPEETASDACKRVNESPSNCLTYFTVSESGTCVMTWEGYTYNVGLINQEYIPITLGGDFAITWGPGIDIGIAAAGVKGDALNVTGNLFSELYDSINEDVPTPAIDWSDCVGILDETDDPFDITGNPDPYENMVDAMNLKYRRSATLLKASSGCTVSASHDAQISLAGITNGTVNFGTDPFKIAGYLVSDVNNPKIGLDGFFSASTLVFKDVNGVEILENDTIDPTSIEIVAPAGHEFSATQISGANVKFSTSLAAVKPGIGFDYVEPITAFDVMVSPNDAWKTEFSNLTYTVDDMVAYDTNNALSLQQDVRKQISFTALPAVASEFYYGTLESDMLSFTRPNIAHDAAPPTVAVDAWIDNVVSGQPVSDLLAMLEHDAVNDLYTFTDATNVNAVYQADRWTKEAVHISAPQGYAMTMTLNLAEVSGIVVDNNGNDEFDSRDLVWMTLSAPNSVDNMYVLFVMADNQKVPNGTICGAMTMEWDTNLLVYKPTSGVYVDCSADTSPILKLSGSENGIQILYNGLDIKNAAGVHELRDWLGDDPNSEVLDLANLAGFSPNEDLFTSLVIATTPTDGMAFEISGFYNGGLIKTGQIGSPAEMSFGF